MRTVLRIVEETGSLDALDWMRIENPPFMSLVIESLGEPGPNDHSALSIAQYGDWNRRPKADGSMTCQPRQTRDLESFMEMWDANSQDRGFLKAFRRTTGQRC